MIDWIHNCNIWVIRYLITCVTWYVSVLLFIEYKERVYFGKPYMNIIKSLINIVLDIVVFALMSIVWPLSTIWALWYHKRMRNKLVDAVSGRK